jgi:putative thioredoxin
MASDIVVEVGEEDFSAQVLDRSHEVPVLVDFWAAWCGPCRVLGPVLEMLAKRLAGRFVLAKVDTERSPALAARYQISSIPAVKLFRNGAVVDEFVGAIPEQAIRDFLDRNCPSEAAELVDRARSMRESGAIDDAVAALDKALELEPRNAGAHLELARIALASGDRDGVESHIRQIPPLADEVEAGNYLREALAFIDGCASAGGQPACEERVAGDPTDLDANFGLGCCLAAAGRYREALDHFLAVVAKNKKWNDEAGRKAMLTVFGIVGIRSELSDAYRKKLALYL